MNILTDVLSLIRRGIFAKTAGLDDYLVLGVNEEPDMTGVASPIPYRSIKLIKVGDFKVAATHCAHANSPVVPASGTGQVYQKTVIDPITQECTVYFRSLKSLSSNLTLAQSADDNYIEITTTGEPNTAANVGTGFGIWKDKVGETLNFRSLVSNNSSITITQSSNEINLESTGGGGTVTSLTTTGTSGASTLVGGILNIPQYSSGGSGEVNTASNVGSGTGVFKQKTGVDLEFKSLTSSNGSILITSNTTEIDLIQESFDVRSVVASGKAFMKYKQNSDGTNAMIGNNYKVMGRSLIANVDHSYSPYVLDWTDAPKFVSSAGGWIIPEEPTFSAIPIGKTLAIGDTIALDFMTTNSRPSGGQVFNAVLGWFECADVTPWPVTMRDPITGTSINGNVGPVGDQSQFQCARLTCTLTTASTFGYIMFGFNFAGAQDTDLLNVSWSLSVVKNKGS
jgi:hypothetical protein